MLLRLLGAALAALVSPPRCAACEARVPASVVFCRACASTVEHAPPQRAPYPDAHADLIAPLLYGGAVAIAITRFKYADRPDLARPLASVILGGIREHGAPPPDLVVPVPLHPARLAERRYNQSALLASFIAGHQRARLSTRALERTRDTPPQAALDRAARATNLRGAFAVRAPGAFTGKRVLLVDDVHTTGATLEACVRVLREDGAREVTCAVIARVAAGWAHGV